MPGEPNDLAARRGFRLYLTTLFFGISVVLLVLSTAGGGPRAERELLATVAVGMGLACLAVTAKILLERSDEDEAGEADAE
jgi:preprotein translocase subunit SecG